MKNTFYLLFLGTISAPAFGQITLTQNDVGPVNKVVNISVDDSSPNVTAGSAGANVTWNVGPLGADIQETFTFANPQFTPYYSSYPSSNLAMITSSPVYAYTSLTANSFSMLGQEDGLSSGGYLYRYLRPETILKFPMTYLSSFDDTSKTELVMYLGFDPGIGNIVDSMRTITDTYKHVVADGWGTLTTSFGTFPSIRLNTLRYETQYSEYLVNGNWIPAVPASTDSSRVYSWWTNNTGVQLLELTEDIPSGTIIDAQYVTGTSTILTVNEPGDHSQLNVFPNPANSDLHIATTMIDYTIELVDLQGRTVISEKAESENYSLDLSPVKAGTYLLRLTETATGKMRYEKICVTH